jgi:hypothetical protein
MFCRGCRIRRLDARGSQQKADGGAAQGDMRGNDFFHLDG